MIMELLWGFWCWLTGTIPPGATSVWDWLEANGGEWYARPAGQHREGMSVAQIREEIRRRDQHAARLRASEHYRLVAA